MIVGEAQVIIMPVGAGFETALKKETQAGLTNVGKDAEKAGEDAGGKLSKGFGKGAGSITGILANLGVPLNTFGGSLDKTAEKMAGVEAHGSKMTQTLAGIGGATLLGATAAVVGFGAAGVDAALKFEEAATSIATHAGIGEDAAKKIAGGFQDMGKTVFNARELAGAYAGVAGELGNLVGHALGAGEATKVMAAAQNLAQASGQNLESTTKDLANVMLAYHVGVNQAAGASDILFSTSRLAGVEQDQLATQLVKVKGKLGDLAPSLGESAGLLDALAKNGVQGRTAMSALSGGFTTLVGAGKPATAMAKELGIGIFDTSGKFVGMRSIIEQLQPKLLGLTEQSQMQATKALFGASANKQLLDVVLKGPGAYEADVSAVTKANAAKEAATQRGKDLSEMFKHVKVVVEELALKFGEFLVPKLVALGNALSTSIGWLEKHKEAAKALAVVIATVLGTAVAVFATQKAIQFGQGVQSMIGSMGKLVTSISNGVSTIIGKFAAQNAAAADSAKAIGGSMAATATETQAAATKITYSTGQVDASFAGTSTAAGAAAKGIGTAETAMVAETQAADAKIATANAAAGASFAGILGKAGLYGLAAYAGLKIGEGAAHLLGIEGNTSELLGGNQPGESGKEGEAYANKHGGYGKGGVAGVGGNPMVSRYASIAQEAGAKYGLPPSLLLADIEQESGGRPVNPSSAGAEGLTQFIPSTAKEYGVKYGESPDDIRSQIFGQAHYLANLGAAKNPKYALEGYLGAHNAEGQQYAASVLGKESSYAGANRHKPATDVVSRLPTSGKGTLPTEEQTKAQTKAVEKAAKEAEKAHSQAAKKMAAEHAKILAAEMKKQTADKKAGESALSKMLEAIHSGGVKTLEKVVGGVHEKGFHELVKNLDGDHKSGLAKLAHELVETHKQAMEKLREEQSKAWEAFLKKLEAAQQKRESTKLGLEDAYYKDKASGEAKQIADATKVALDHAAEAGLSGANLVAAQAQTALDALKQRNDAALGAAQLTVDQAAFGTELMQARAKDRLSKAEDAAAVSEAQAQATVELTANAAKEAIKKTQEEEAKRGAEEKTAEEAKRKKEEQEKTGVPPNAVAGASPALTININGMNRSSAELLQEITWQLKTGSLPLAK
jgi:TP901 family phage tail tape measure protein